VQIFAQGLDLLSDDEEDTEEILEYAKATFKTNRVINGHSIETVAKREFDFKISHRFGFLNTGAYDFFGLDQATMRIGGDFGITDQLNVGIGRSNVDKTYDGFVKYKFLRQSSGTKNMPISAVAISHMGITTLKWTDPNRKNYPSSRLHYTHQLLLARKFNESFSLQLSPTLVHKNLIDSLQYSNDIFALGFGLRQKLTKRVTLNLEYFYVFENQIPEENTNSLSLGFDIETGGHVFQLFFTNAAAAFEKAFITDTKGDWSNGDVRFGFNIARMFSF
jgi:opacity protein-like surface antigen